jgi:hypothetical protein
MITNTPTNRHSVAKFDSYVVFVRITTGHQLADFGLPAPY